MARRFLQSYSIENDYDDEKSIATLIINVNSGTSYMLKNKQKTKTLVKTNQNITDFS